MKKKLVHLTTAQFAKMHNVNKRTLHYYDNIGLFSPCTKGENGYRYYEISQSIDFEYIRMLKDLNMSIEEIKLYLRKPSPDKFIEIAETKEKEIENQIKKLKHIKKILQIKKEQVNFCNNLQEQEIKVINCKKEKISIIPYSFVENDISKLFDYVKNIWNLEQIQMGVGGMLSLKKVMNKEFELYDKLYTPVLNSIAYEKIYTKPEGTYLCGYQKGRWDRIPELYEKMIAFAKKNDLKLTGYAYELGLNEFVISSQEDYITQIMIKIDK